MTDQQETIKDLIDNIISFIASPQSDTALEQIIDDLIKDLEEENKSILNKGTDIMWTNTINTLKDTKPTFITIDEGEENRQSLYSIYSHNQDDEDLIIFLTTIHLRLPLISQPQLLERHHIITPTHQGDSTQWSLLFLCPLTI